MTSLTVTQTSLDGLLLIKPRVFQDTRGYFYESWRSQDYRDAGVPIDFLQDNCSYSKKGVLRGLHIQKSQGQILWVAYGRVMQATVDVRPNSPTFGKSFVVELSNENPIQVYMPPGFAGGFLVLSDVACMNYKCSQYYSPKDEGGVLWNDPDLGIAWGTNSPIMSERDLKFPHLRNINPADLI